MFRRKTPAHRDYLDKKRELWSSDIHLKNRNKQKRNKTSTFSLKRGLHSLSHLSHLPLAQPPAARLPPPTAAAPHGCHPLRCLSPAPDTCECGGHVSCPRSFLKRLLGSLLRLRWPGVKKRAWGDLWWFGGVIREKRRGSPISQMRGGGGHWDLTWAWPSPQGGRFLTTCSAWD